MIGNMSNATAGTVVQLNISDGGAPKQPVERITVRAGGVAGDRQRMARHGGPDRAVMLFSLEQIERLHNQGHPIYPGAVGENITTRGVDLGRLGPGDRIRIGDAVMLEVASYPTPCDGIGGAFLNRDFMQVEHNRHPGMSRLACRVLQEGEVQTGDPVSVLQATESDS